MAVTVDAWIGILLPGLEIDSEQLAVAIELGEQRRPACLTQPLGDEAVAAYAAWVLYGQIQAAQALALPARPMGVTSEKLGDQQRDYGASEGSNDPLGLLGRYNDLARLCGSITVGTPRWPTCS
jgi:hypothetical protein